MLTMTARGPQNSKGDETFYCICQKKYVEGQFMIECGKCNEWFHGSCVGIEEYQAEDIDVYHCPKCEPVHGPLVYSFLDVTFRNGTIEPVKVKKRRNKSRHNYRDIHEGIKQITNGSVMFVRQLKAKSFCDAYDVIEQFENGHKLKADYFQQYGFSQPILIHQKNGLGLVVPPSNFTIYDVEQRIGSMYELHVIDVARQEDLRMKMREWTEYYNSPVRGKVLNVISCEFSNTSLTDLVMAPEFVRNVSWVENVWPQDSPDDNAPRMPVVAKYCLMSVKDCYTDFHIDFGGTSVWYHIIRGEKIFYLIEPTSENLEKYEDWVSSSDQSQVFLGDRVDKCYKLYLKQGNTLLIPTGWIHAVLTPTDSLVFGGNFLQSFNIPLQLRIYKLEKSLSTPLKFLFPQFETTNWYAARLIVKKIKDIHDAGYRIPRFLYDGVKELLVSFKSWTATKGEYVKHHRLQIPAEINAAKLIKSLQKILKTDKNMDPSRDFPVGELPSPALLSVKCSKTILKLKLPRRSESESSTVSSPERSANIEMLERRRDKLKKKEQRLKDGLSTNKQLHSIKLNIKKEDDEGLKAKNIKLKLSLPTSVADSKEQADGDDDSSLDITSPYSQPFARRQDDENKHVDMKSEIEAAKKDLFQMSNKSSGGLYFRKTKEEDGTINPVTFNPNRELKAKPKLNNLNRESDDDNSDEGGYVVDFLPKPKPPAEKKRKQSNHDDSDYDPTDDSYYQDAEYVYPRIDVTSEITTDDFSWKPGQRKKPKTCCYKKDRATGSPSRLKGSRPTADPDDFFAPDDSDEELFCTNPKPRASKQNPSGQMKAKVSDRTQSDTEKVPSATHEKPVKDRPKKGFATAKQRLGKLLKLDKTGSRYMR